MALTLAAKLAEVMGAIERVPKRGKNTFHGYDYVTEADLADAIRSELAKRKVMLVPSVQACEMRDMPPTAKGKAQFLTTVMVEWTFTDGESGEQIKFNMPGFGIDGEDKGGYKALTGSEKYALMKAFLVPTGDDPEREEAERPALRQPRPSTKPNASASPKPEEVPSVPMEKVRGKVGSEVKTNDKGTWIKVDEKPVYIWNFDSYVKQGLKSGLEVEIEAMVKQGAKGKYYHATKLLTVVPAA